MSNLPQPDKASPLNLDLWQALAQGQLGLVQHALHGGADVHALDSKGCDALMQVVCAPDAARVLLMDLLLDAEANPCRTNARAAPDRSSAWLSMMTLGDPRSALHLLSRCPQIVAWHESQGLPPLFAALSHQKEALIVPLLAAGANPNVRWPAGKMYAYVNTPHAVSALHLAVTKDMPLATAALLDAGATCDPGVEDGGLYTDAITRAQRRALPVLMDHGTALTPTDVRDIVPTAVANAVPWALIERLIAHGADPHGVSSRYGTALHAATSSSSLFGFVEPLLALGLDPSARPSLFWASPLETVARVNRPDHQALVRRMEQAVLEQTLRRASPSLPKENARLRSRL